MGLGNLILRLSVTFTLSGGMCVTAQQAPLIRSDVNVVEVSVSVRDSAGKTPGGLNAGDFRVWDNGKEQAIRSVERLASSEAVALPANTYSNRIGEGTRPQVLSMILLDGLNTPLRQQQRAKQYIARVLTQIEPDERVAIFTLGATLSTLHPFSSDRKSLVAKLAPYLGEINDLPDEDDLFARISPIAPALLAMSQSNRVEQTFVSLEALANHVKGVPGRKNLLWLSAAFPLEFRPSTSTGDPNLDRYLQSAPFRYARNYGKEMEHAARALNAANVAVYPIDARSLSTNPTASLNQGTMMLLAAETGGKAFYNRNDIDRAVRLALDDTRDSYLLTYAPAEVVRNGAFHRIRVETTRAELQLRHRRGYYAPQNDSSAADLAPRLESAITSPLDISGIGLRATIAAGEAADIGVELFVDAADLALSAGESNRTGELRIDMIQIDPDGATYGGIRQTVNFAVPQERYQRVLEEGVRFNLKLKREPKANALRIAVGDQQSGRVGSLTVTLR